tara:strand:- start:21063 stop:22766 length:1704 start_codon:yes stop_codon:yes gene_type:complete
MVSCQKEHEEVDPVNEQETLMASSAIAKLIEQTVSNDGSYDNIVDGSSCFNVRFPYTVQVNGLELLINTMEDLQLVEMAFDALDDDENILDIYFPVTVTLGDYTEVTVNGKEDLLTLSEQCIEGGDDDDIECIDFVYPISLFTFDIGKQQTGKIIVNSDREWRRFFAGLDDEDLVGIDFPVVLELHDETEVEIHSNTELASAIESAKNACDEDDDDDYNDDDFTQERLDEYLVECFWLIREVERNDLAQTEQYFEYAMNFTEAGEVTLIDRGGNRIAGTWATGIVNHNVVLNLDFEVLVAFNLEWFVNEIEEGKIKLYSGDDNKIVMKKACNLFSDEPDALGDVLRECSWIVKKVKNEGEEMRRLLGYEFNFMAGGVVTLGNGDNTSEGTWESTTNAQGRLVMAIDMGQEPGVSFEWPLADLRDDRLKFEIEETDYELILERNCDNDENDDDVITIRGLFNKSLWEVAYFAENENFSTELYGGYLFSFGLNGQLTVLNPNEQEVDTARWFVYRNSEQKLEMIITFEVESNFYALGNDYHITEVSENRLELKHQNDWGGFNDLVLEKL